MRVRLPCQRSSKLRNTIDRVTSLNFPNVYSLLQRIDSAFRHVGEAVEKDSRQELLNYPAC